MHHSYYWPFGLLFAVSFWRRYTQSVSSKQKHSTFAPVEKCHWQHGWARWQRKWSGHTNSPHSPSSKNNTSVKKDCPGNNCAWLRNRPAWQVGKYVSQQRTKMNVQSILKKIRLTLLPGKVAQKHLSAHMSITVKFIWLRSAAILPYHHLTTFMS